MKELFSESSNTSMSRVLSIASFVTAVILVGVSILTGNDLENLIFAFLSFGGTIKVGNKAFEGKK